MSMGGESASGLFVTESPDKLIDCSAVLVDKSVVLLIKPLEESDIGSG